MNLFKRMKTDNFWGRFRLYSHKKILFSGKIIIFFYSSFSSSNALAIRKLLKDIAILFFILFLFVVCLAKMSFKVKWKEKKIVVKKKSVFFWRRNAFISLSKFLIEFFVFSLFCFGHFFSVEFCLRLDVLAFFFVRFEYGACVMFKKKKNKHFLSF